VALSDHKNSGAGSGARWAVLLAALITLAASALGVLEGLPAAVLNLVTKTTGDAGKGPSPEPPPTGPVSVDPRRQEQRQPRYFELRAQLPGEHMSQATIVSSRGSKVGQLTVYGDQPSAFFRLAVDAPREFWYELNSLVTLRDYRNVSCVGDGSIAVAPGSVLYVAFAESQLGGCSATLTSDPGVGRVWSP